MSFFTDNYDRSFRKSARRRRRIRRKLSLLGTREWVLSLVLGLWLSSLVSVKNTVGGEGGGRFLFLFYFRFPLHRLAIGIFLISWIMRKLGWIFILWIEDSPTTTMQWGGGGAGGFQRLRNPWIFNKSCITRLISNKKKKIIIIIVLKGPVMNKRIINTIEPLLVSNCILTIHTIEIFLNEIAPRKVSLHKSKYKCSKNYILCFFHFFSTKIKGLNHNHRRIWKLDYCWSLAGFPSK